MRLPVPVAAVAIAVLLALAAAPSARADYAPVSSAAQLYTCCTPPELQDRIFEEAAASGAAYVRVDVELHGIFGDGADRADWRRLDAMVERARRAGVRVLGMIRGTPLWLSTCRGRSADKATICAPRNPGEWGRLAGQVADHAKGEIDHWEIGNEPDADWAFLGSPEDYARMLSAAHDAIKAAVPDAKVVFGGVERPDHLDWIERVLATPGGGLQEGPLVKDRVVIPKPEDLHSSSRMDLHVVLAQDLVVEARFGEVQVEAALFHRRCEQGVGAVVLTRCPTRSVFS